MRSNGQLHQQRMKWPSDSSQKMTKQEIPCYSQYPRGLLVSQALHKEIYSLSNTVFQESRIPAVIHSSTHWWQSIVVTGNKMQASAFWMVYEQYFWTSANLSLEYYRGRLGRKWKYRELWEWSRGISNNNSKNNTNNIIIIKYDS